MSAIRTGFEDIGYAGLKMSAEEYLALGPTAERYELIGGVVTMSPSPSIPHNEIGAEIIHQLKSYSGNDGALRVLPETDVRLNDFIVYRPDICVYKAERLSPRATRLDIPPDLVVEILSPGSKPLDFITKRDDYEKFGVGEYWIVDPADGRVRAWKRDAVAGVLTEAPVSGDRLASAAIAGLILDLAAIRRLSIAQR